MASSFPIVLKIFFKSIFHFSHSIARQLFSLSYAIVDCYIYYVTKEVERAEEGGGVKKQKARFEETSGGNRTGEENLFSVFFLIQIAKLKFSSISMEIYCSSSNEEREGVRDKNQFN
jgi:hypothetical protein